HGQRGTEPRGERLATAPVPVEKLDDARRLSERADPLLDTLTVERVRHPDSAAGEDRVRRPLQEFRLGGGPAEDGADLVTEAHLHGQRKRSRSAGITSSRAEPSPEGDSPRTIAAGTPRVLPLTRSAAPAISSATAISVPR